MSCLYPLKAFQVVDPITGELRLVFSDLDQASFMKADPGFPFLRRLVLPCGQCEECRSDRAHKWADRLSLEAKVNPGRSWFVTLTYDDDHLPRLGKPVLDRETGFVGDLPVLNMDDFSAFIKRLRSRLSPQKLRYFCCGEYGELSRRPHGHCVLFANLTDLRGFRPGSDGPIKLPPGTYFSQVISDAWGKGGITVQEANAWAMSYVAGYAVKKLKGLLAEDYAAECSALGVSQQPPECARMSRRPGIGVPFLSVENAADGGSVAIPTPSGAFRAPTPRVFERYLDPDRVQDYKDARARRSEARAERLAQLRPDEYIEEVQAARVRVNKSRARVRKQKL